MRAQMNNPGQPIATSPHIDPYSELLQQIHDDLRLQHPEWVEPSGESPMCDFYEARLMYLLGQSAFGCASERTKPETSPSRMRHRRKHTERLAREVSRVGAAAPGNTRAVTTKSTTQDPRPTVNATIEEHENLSSQHDCGKSDVQVDVKASVGNANIICTGWVRPFHARARSMSANDIGR